MRRAGLKTWLMLVAGGLLVACSFLASYEGISDGELPADASSQLAEAGAPIDAPYDGRLVKCGMTACALDWGEVCCIATSQRMTLSTVCALAGHCPDAEAPNAEWDASLRVSEIACDDTADCAHIEGGVCCQVCGNPCGSGHRGSGVCVNPEACLGSYDQVACDPTVTGTCPRRQPWQGRCDQDDDPVRSGYCFK